MNQKIGQRVGEDIFSVDITFGNIKIEVMRNWYTFQHFIRHFIVWDVLISVFNNNCQNYRKADLQCNEIKTHFHRFYVLFSLKMIGFICESFDVNTRHDCRQILTLEIVFKNYCLNIFEIHPSTLPYTSIYL